MRLLLPGLSVRLPVRSCVVMMMLVMVMVGRVMRVVRSLSHGHVHRRSGVPLPRPLSGQGLKLVQGDHGRGCGGPPLALGPRVEQSGLRLLLPVLESLSSYRVSLKRLLSELRLRPGRGLLYDFLRPVLSIHLTLWHVIGLLACLRHLIHRLISHRIGLWHVGPAPLWHMSLPEVIGIGHGSGVGLSRGGLAHERERPGAVVAPRFPPRGTALSPVVPRRAPLTARRLGLPLPAPRSGSYRRVSGVIRAVGAPRSLVVAGVRRRPPQRVPRQLTERRRRLRGA